MIIYSDRVSTIKKYDCVCVIFFEEVDEIGKQNRHGSDDKKKRYTGFVQVQSRTRTHEMADDDKRATSAATNDIQTAECPGVIQQGPQVFDRLSVFTPSNHNSNHIVATLLGHDHEQYAVGNVTEAQYGVRLHTYLIICKDIIL